MGICLSRADDAVNGFLDRQSRYYTESKHAKEYAEKKKKATAATTDSSGDSSHVNAVLQSGLSPVYPSLPKNAEKHHCHHVYDGDTLTLEDAKNGTRVRLLGIDTPELKEKQPFAVEAKEYTKKYCHKRDIWISFDEKKDNNSENEKADHYGRLLAFIWVPLDGNPDGGGTTTNKPKKKKQSSTPQQWLCINEGLIAAGLACAYSPSNAKKVHNYDKLVELQKLARTHKKGQWKDYKDYEVVVTPNGSAFHKLDHKNGPKKSDCKHLARSKNVNVILASDAFDRGLHPCRKCLE